jgi:hypothetical protein
LIYIEKIKQESRRDIGRQNNRKIEERLSNQMSIFSTCFVSPPLPSPANILENKHIAIMI